MPCGFVAAGFDGGADVDCVKLPNSPLIDSVTELIRDGVELGLYDAEPNVVAVVVGFGANKT